MFSISLNKWFFTCVTKAVKGKILNKVSESFARAAKKSQNSVIKYMPKEQKDSIIKYLPIVRKNKVSAHWAESFQSSSGVKVVLF